MDTDPPVPPSSAPKKVSTSVKKPKFTPKPPPRRKTAPVLTKSDSSDADAETEQELLRKVNEHLRARGPKVEKKSSGNDTTSHGAGSSVAHDPKKVGNTKNNQNLRETSEKNVMFSSSISTKVEDIDHMFVDDESGSSSKSENEYEEPWDPRSYYPITLPLRPPGSGDPEVLNAEEYGEEKEYDESKINSTFELGLLGPVDNEKIIFFQFPEKLPLDRVPISSKGKEKVGPLGSLKEDASSKYFGLKDLPDGFIGKMLIYKSGSIKLKLGDTIFDVYSGTPCGCDRSAAMMNTKSKNCCVLGKVDKQAIVTPDVNSILDNINQLQDS